MKTRLVEIEPVCGCRAVAVSDFKQREVTPAMVRRARRAFDVLAAGQDSQPSKRKKLRQGSRPLRLPKDAVAPKRRRKAS